MSLVRIGGPPPLPSYLMDLALSEEFSFPGEATKFPVEVGVEFTDHIRELPEEITLECIVSDTPIGDVATDSSRQPVTGPDGTTSTALPSAEALQRMRELKAAQQPVRIETTLGVFTSMAFVDLQTTVSKDKSPGRSDPDPKKQKPGALFFTAKFRKAVLVTNKRTKVRVRSSMAGAGGQSKVKTLTATGIQIIKTIKWFHGDPPGTPFHEGNIVELVNVGYVKPAGVPSDQIPGLINEQLKYESIGFQTGAVKFIDANGEQITGARLDALRLDLLRDRRDLGASTSGPFFPPQAIGPGGPTGAGTIVPRPKPNLPPSIDVSKWNLPPGFAVP